MQTATRTAHTPTAAMGRVTASWQGRLASCLLLVSCFTSTSFSFPLYNRACNLSLTQTISAVEPLSLARTVVWSRPSPNEPKQDEEERDLELSWPSDWVCQLPNQTAITAVGFACDERIVAYLVRPDVAVCSFAGIPWTSRVVIAILAFAMVGPLVVLGQWWVRRRKAARQKKEIWSASYV